MRVAAARTLIRLAYIDRKLGRLEEARAMAERALAVFESLASNESPALVPLTDVAEAEVSLARTEVQSRDFPKAAEHVRRAVDSLEQALHTFPGDERLVPRIGQCLRRTRRRSTPFTFPRQGGCSLPQRVEAPRGAVAEHPGDAQRLRRFRQYLGSPRPALHPVES